MTDAEERAGLVAEIGTLRSELLRWHENSNRAAEALRERQSRIDAALALITEALEGGPFLDWAETRAVLAALRGEKANTPG